MKRAICASWIGGAALALAIAAGATGPAEGERPGPPGAADAPALADSVTGRQFLPLPIVFYTPETKWGVGAGVLHTFHTGPGTRASMNGLLLVFTQQKQFSGSLAPEIFTRGNRWRLAGELGWSRFPDQFYGLGNETHDTDEEAYTLEHTRLTADVRRTLRPALYGGVCAHYQHTKAKKYEPGGALSSGSVPGYAGGDLVGIGGVLAFDDRDVPLLPSRGSLLTLVYRRYDAALGSDYESDRFELDARSYVSPAARHTLAIQTIFTASGGTRPFYDLATLGGASTLRGIYEGRYRDRCRVVGQLEYRFPVYGRFGGAIFAGAGEVAHEISGFRMDGLHGTGGVGIRYRILTRDAVRLRIDYAWARGESGLYFAAGEAF